MAAMIQQTCASCNKTFNARKVDIRRGWAKCCSKSCAATYRNETRFKTRQNRVKHAKSYHDIDDDGDYASGWDEDGWLSDDSGVSRI